MARPNTQDTAFLRPLAIIVSTVLVARLVTNASRAPSPVVFGIQTHHWMYGLGLFYVGVARHSLPIACIGIGLVVDELDQVAAALYPSYPPDLKRFPPWQLYETPVPRCPATT